MAGNTTCFLLPDCNKYDCDSPVGVTGRISILEFLLIHQFAMFVLTPIRITTHTDTHTHTAQNVLVFDGGRTVKLTDFGTAVAVGEVTSMQGLKGLTPYFAAPEVIKGEVPKFSADIWSVLCILIEMLTARYPGHHHVGTNEVAMMFLVSSCVCATSVCAEVYRSLSSF